MNIPFAGWPYELCKGRGRDLIFRK